MIEIKLPDNELCPESMSIAPQSERSDWGHTPLDVASAWLKATGRGVKVAICDTGISSSHPDLSGQVVAARDFTGSRSGAEDVQGHGTHCAGIVASKFDNNGLVGVAPDAKLINSKVLGDQGSGADTWIAAGVDWAVSQGAHVVSMSLGSSQRSPTIVAACQRAIDAGVIVVIAAGNAGPGENTIGWPGAMPGAVCVAAVAESLQVASFSSRGQNQVVAAPGVQIESTYPGGRYAKMSGTSMATPYVAGCAALYVEACIKAGVKPSQREFIGLISTTSRDLGQPGKDTAYGYGLVQPVKIIDKVLVVTPPPPPPTDKPVVVNWSDLKDESKIRLKNAGIDAFSFEIDLK